MKNSIITKIFWCFLFIIVVLQMYSLPFLILEENLHLGIPGIKIEDGTYAIFGMDLVSIGNIMAVLLIILLVILVRFYKVLFPKTKTLREERVADK